MQPRHYISQFPFDGRQVRVLLFRESDNRGRRLLFDSNALQKVFLQAEEQHKPNKDEHNNGIFTNNCKLTTTRTTTIHNNHASNNINGNNNCHFSNKQKSNVKVQTQQQTTHSKDFVEVCDEYGYKHNRKNSAEVISLGEMVFGALAMSYRGTAFKLHWLAEPARILCSEVFLTPLAANAHNASRASSLSSSYSFSSINHLSATPRTSISSEHSSLDGLSIGSSSMPFNTNVARHSISTSVESDAIGIEFSAPHYNNNTSDKSSRYSSNYSMGTDSGYSGLSRSLWSSVASQQYSTHSNSLDKTDSLRKFYINQIPLLSSSSLNNGGMQRRISRNLCTSFENDYSFNDLIGFTCDYSQCQSVSLGGSEGCSMHKGNNNNNNNANETSSYPEISRRRDANNAKCLPRRAKLGLAVCITFSESFEQEMEMFCSEHAAPLESMLSRVRASTEQAYINHKDFLNVMYRVWKNTQQWLMDFFSAPRIQCPVWLSVTTSGSKYSKNVAERFVKELCWLLALADTKDTNFFISTMLTATLTHHLGWVSTMASNTYSSCSEYSAEAVEQRAKLLQISQNYPYNALWAQMGDLFGSVGEPPKLARTIIYGTQKLPVERLLNILTFFIRCSEVRYTVKNEIYNKQSVDLIINKNSMEIFKQAKAEHINAEQQNAGLVRTQTFKRNLSCMNDEQLAEDNNFIDETALALNLKKNEIPNVLAFRDSRFVKQELRIGNFLMDTGIEKSAVFQTNDNNYMSKVPANDERIRLTVTTPDNVEVNLENDFFINQNQNAAEAKAVEAIEMDVNAISVENNSNSNCKYKNAMQREKKKNFFWNIVPHALRDGLCFTEQHGYQLKNKDNNKTSKNFEYEQFAACTTKTRDEQTKLAQVLSFTSLSDLITQNSMGKSDRMTWGIEPMKENVCYEEQMHFDFNKLLIEREHGIMQETASTVKIIDANDDVQHEKVVFVLGDNEPLVNIKRSAQQEPQTNDNMPTTKELNNDDVVVVVEQEEQKSCDVDAVDNNSSNKKPTLCTIHQRAHVAQLNCKKHSGVKFNFEQYPQIATNYMKSKNLIMSSYNMLIDKSIKLDDNATLTQLPNTIFPAISSGNGENSACGNVTDCIVCSNILKTYQTPSNATELEFETDQMHCYTTQQHDTTAAAATTTATERSELHTVSSVSSVETLKSVEQQQRQCSDATEQEHEQTQHVNEFNMLSSCKQSNSKHLQHSLNNVQFLQMPVPSIKELRADEATDNQIKKRTGFMPSMFLNFCDHYVPDMILQGTCAPPAQWEEILRVDLGLAARSGALISLPMENVAIIADMERWDVRLISSQAHSFSTASDQSAPVGMSQLVSTMLETVQAMNNAGISAYDCLSYIESKLQEIYLHSESLATFLLETDFCPLNLITRALNISENDLPLLLSIASVHTPQISHKCGISFK